MDWGKIAISTRIGNGADPLFVCSWNKLIMRGLRPGDKVLNPVIELPQHFAAEALAHNFLRTDCDTILFVDDDMIFDPSDLDKMSDDPETFDFDILQGLCLSRNPPHYPIIATHYKDGQFKIASKPPKDSIVDVAYCGLGFTLIRRTAFEAVKKAKDADDLFFHWSKNGCSEDTGFCLKAAKAGCKIGVSTRVQIGHRIKVTVTWDFEDNAPGFDEIDRGTGRLMKDIRAESKAATKEKELANAN